MKGKFYAIGVGPGDPKLITIKACEVINRCGAAAFPKSMEKESTAFKIAEKYINPTCSIIKLDFFMKNDINKRKELRFNAAEKICTFLDKEIDVCFITLGDPSIYSTSMYIFEILKERGYECEVIAGVPSFCAAAASLGINIAEDNDIFTVIPSNIDGEKENILFENSDSVILMKFFKNKSSLRKAQEKGYNIFCIENCSMENEKIYKNLEEIENKNIGYFTTAILKKNKTL